MNTEYITLKSVANEIYSHPLMRDLSMETIVSNTLELIQIIGFPVLFEPKQETVEIKDWRGPLPCDFYDINQVMLDTGGNERIAFRASTDTFGPVGQPTGSDYTYKIRGRVVYTSIKEGSIIVSYKAIALDSEGFPYIINDAAFIRALRSYIKMNWFRVISDMGQIDQYAMESAERDYYANIAVAENSLTRLTVDQMESISRLMNSALLRPLEHSTGFKDINKGHQIKVQRS